jgi:hypothetical protein
MHSFYNIQASENKNKPRNAGISVVAIKYQYIFDLSLVLVDSLV